jgi:hypothetical protein
MINFKAGDKVWVLCTAIGDSTMASVPVEHCLAEFYASMVDCLPLAYNSFDIEIHKVGDIENRIASASEIDAKTKQCIVDYFMKKIDEMAEKGCSRWWTTESHITKSKHLESVLEYFKEKGYIVEQCYESGHRVCIGW